jgi:hypothetical protein
VGEITYSPFAFAAIVFDIPPVRGANPGSQKVKERKMQNIQTNQPSNGVLFEMLENRTLLSAAPHPAAAITLDQAPQLNQPLKHAKAKVKKAKVKMPKAAPAIVEPAVTDPSITYRDFSKEPLFSSTGPSLNDINQGYVGDCYFLSTLSAVAATNPARIQNDIFANGDGTYTVKLVSHNKAQSVRVDAQLPVWPNGQLAYAGLGAEKSLWVAVMEKAWAQVRTKANSYASIASGWMKEAFSALGVKSKSVLKAKSATKLLTQLQADLKSGQATTIGTSNVPAGVSLIGDHAYEVDAIEVDATGAPVSVRLRNPWGIDGIGSDGNNDGYVTITGNQLFAAYAGVVSA